MENKTLKKFFKDEKSGGLVLIVCTLLSLIIANSALKMQYAGFWHTQIGFLNIEQWINDALMAVFFLMIGLELVRERYLGEFANPRNAILPVIAALGGMLVPAGFYLLFNYGLPTQSGIGIPMATDIAFALGILSLLGKRVPPLLKIFLMSLAVADDLGAIIVIAFFYTKDLVLSNLGIALGTWLVLFVLRHFKIYSLIPYIIGGVIMWYFMLQSGIHATITGVLLAFAIPFRGNHNSVSPALTLLDKLHTPVTFVILPIFALANTAVTISSGFPQMLFQPEFQGILIGLCVGKPLGIFTMSWLMIKTKISHLPVGVRFKDLLGAGILGGVGFTMSIFITLLAFDDQEIVNIAKISILISSLIAAIVGSFYLKIVLPKSEITTLTDSL